MIQRVRSVRHCPDNCVYRNRRESVCGYCLMEILGKAVVVEEEEYGGEQDETEDIEQAVRERV